MAYDRGLRLLRRASLISVLHAQSASQNKCLEVSTDGVMILANYAMDAYRALEVRTSARSPEVTS